MGRVPEQNKREPHTTNEEPLTVCGKPMVYFQGPVRWCEECRYRLLKSGEVPRVCEPWDADPTAPEERYKELFRAGKALWHAGIADEDEIIPTLAFAARSFEVPGLANLRERLAAAGNGGESWRKLKTDFRGCFETLEVMRVVDGVPIIYSKPFQVLAYTYKETGVVEKVVIEVYRRSAKAEEISRWYDKLLSQHDVSYESGEGRLGWIASTGCLRVVIQPQDPAANPSLKQLVDDHPEKTQLPFPHPDAAAGMCDTLLGSVSEKRKYAGFAFALGGRERGRDFNSDNLIPSVVGWYVGGRGNAIKQHSWKPTVAKVLNENLISPCHKLPFNESGWDSNEYRWELMARVSQQILRIDNELRDGLFTPSKPLLGLISTITP